MRRETGEKRDRMKKCTRETRRNGILHGEHRHACTPVSGTRLRKRKGQFMQHTLHSCQKRVTRDTCIPRVRLVFLTWVYRAKNGRVRRGNWKKLPREQGAKKKKRRMILENKVLLARKGRRKRNGFSRSSHLGTRERNAWRGWNILVLAPNSHLLNELSRSCLNPFSPFSVIPRAQIQLRS